MATQRQTELEHLEELRATHARRLRVLERQLATYGENEAPAHLILEREDAERELRRLQSEIRLQHAGQVTSTPYLGLNAFHEQHADFFHGRAALISELIDKIKAERFLAVLGPSGSGKSSVVRAGLIPMLKAGALAGSERWHYLTFLPGARPLNTLASALVGLPGGTAFGTVFDLRDRLADRDDGLLTVADTLLADQRGGRLVLIIDQAEELWTLAPTEEEALAAHVTEQLRPFFQCLLKANDAPESPVLVVLTMRADFLHRAAYR